MTWKMLPILMAAALWGCRDSIVVDGPKSIASTLGAYVVNEGGFSGGGSLSYYDERRDTLFNDVAGNAANWLFPNDMKIVGSRGYVAVNGSDKVDVIDPGSNRIVASIAFPQFSGPGYFASAAPNLLVANYNGTMSSIAMGADTVAFTTPPVVAFPGGIASAGGKAFISDYGTYVNNQFVPGSFVKVLNPSTGQVTDSIALNAAPGAMTVLNGKVFVVCAGTQTVHPRLYQIDPILDKAEDSLELSGSVSDIVNDGRNLFVLASDAVGKFAVQPLRTIQADFISRSGGLYFYSLGADALTGDIYVTNVVGSGGAGRLEIYTSSGLSKRPPQPVGIFPGAIAFYQAH